MAHKPHHQAKTPLKLIVSAFSGVGLLLAMSIALLFGAPSAQAACSALPTGKGTVAMNLSVPSAGSYRVWTRMLSPSAGVNGFYLQIADGNACQITMGDAAIPTGTWTWVDYQNGTTTSKVNVTLTAGSHQVNLAGLDDGVQIDKVLLLSDAACTPTGDGSNCTSAATSTTPTPTPTPGGGGGGSTPAPTPTIIPIGTSSGSSSKPTTVSNTIAIPTTGVSNAKCAIDGMTVDCSLVDTKNLTDGNHAITVTGTDKDGKPIKQTTTIKVKNKATLKEQIIAGVQNFRWPLLALVIILIAAPVAWYLNRRFGLLARLRPGSSSASVIPSGASIPPPSTPPSKVIYPDDPNKPL